MRLLQSLLTANHLSTAVLQRGCAYVVLLLGMLLSLSSAGAMPLAGSLITNQARANYVDSVTGLSALLTSNIVEVQVQQVSAFLLSASQARVVSPGAVVYLPHQLRNTGNGSDSFNLSAATAAGGFTATNLAIYADANADGIPDNATPLSNTGVVAPGGGYNVVLAVTVPATAAVGAAGVVVINAVATATPLPAAAQTNTDTLTVSTRAVVSVNKTLSLVSGLSPNNNGGNHLLVTLTLVNNGNMSATNVQFSDVIGGVSAAPAFNTTGFSYVLGSARWNGMVLPDAGVGAPSGITYSSTTVAGVTTLSGMLSTLSAGSVAQITFAVDVLPGLPVGSTQTNNIAMVTYSDGLSQQSINSNAATYTVQAGAALSPDLILTKSHVGNFTVGFPGVFNLSVRNLGSAPTVGNVTVSDTLPTGLTFVSAGSGGNGWLCSALGQQVTCSNPAVIAIGATALTLPITVMPTVAAQLASPLLNTARVGDGSELPLYAGNNTASDSVIIGLAASVSGRVWFDINHNRIYDVAEPLVPSWQVELLNAAGQIVATALTGANGAYSFAAVLPGNGYQLRFRDSANGAYYASPVNGEAGAAAWAGATVSGGMIQNLNLLPGNNVTQQSLPLDPSGVVYDAISRMPVPGATVNLVGPVGFDPALHLFGGLSNATQVVGVQGIYQFLLLAGAPAGLYQLSVTPPVGYVAPSTLIPAQPIALTPPVGVGQLQVQAQPGPPAVGSPTTYFLKLNLAAGVQDVINNHIPIDPILVAGSGLLVSKVASRTSAEPGDFVDYTIQVKNVTAGIMPATMLQDSLPRGFRYQLGSARLNNAPLADPLGSAGSNLTFALGTLLTNTTATLTYRVAIGMAAPLGTGINRAQASSGVAGSNVATAAVQIIQGVFTDKGYVLGTVYLDCNKNHLQEVDEPGIPGVRLFLEDGTNVVTDSDGKYSLYGIVARTHVLKLDDTTLPIGAVLETLANRNAGVAGSRFVDLKNGELHRADFASDTCSEDVLHDVKIRHGKNQITETERALNYKLNPQASILPAVDSRALPASGELGNTSAPTAASAAESFQPLLKDTGLTAENSNLPTLPVAPVATIDLDKLLEKLNNEFDFVDLKDQDVLPMAQTSVRIKGSQGTTFRLAVNGQEVGAERVGKKSVVADKQLEAWEYIGITLKPGDNTLTIKQIDPFGNARGERTIHVIAPDRLASIIIDAPKTVEANGRTPFTVAIKLVDENGVLVTTRTYLTLETQYGRWQTKDLNPKERGVQVFMEGGKAEFTLLPPAQPAQEDLRILSGILKGEHHIAYLPELRPLIAAGVIEGNLNLRSLNASSLLPTSSNDSFEQQIQRISGGNGKNNAAARTALFLKGKVKGEYLLTLAYDSDKLAKERLFRDIQPDEFYPVYGDSSTKGFDAQSTSRLYVRVDKGQSFLLYGDYTTQSLVPARSLSQYNRSLTGVKEHYENDKVMVNAFASQDTNRQVVEEIPANGTSGPFQLANNGALINSEKVEILTRDRAQPALILRTEPQTRFADYEIEQYTGRLLFKGPVASLDANLNPKSIRISYELDQGGKAFWVTGIDGQMKITDKLEIGGVVARDSNPQQASTLTGANASFKLAEKTVVVGEIAHTNTVKGTGNAERLELRHDEGAFQGRIYTGRSDATFDNAASILNNGRRESGAKASYKLDSTTLLSGEMIASGDVVTGSNRNGVLLKAEKTLSDTWRVEGGVRDTRETALTPGTPATHVTSARLKATAQIASIKGLSVNGEYEQDVRDSAKKVAAIGAEYQMENRGRLYARHEFMSSLTSAFALNSTQRSNTTVIGMDTDYTPDTHLFSEYRARGVLDGRQAEAAVGLRNKYQIDEGLRLNTSVERIINMAGGTGRAAQAYTGAIEYTANPFWKGSTRLEYRNADTASGWLNSIDAASKLTDSWTIIGKHVFSENTTKGLTPGSRIQQRLQAGLAWRDLEEHDWNALSKFEHRRESDTTAGASIKRLVDIFSVHANYQPASDWQASAHYAAKWVTDQSLGLQSHSNSHLVSGRVMWDVTERWDVGVIASAMGDRGFRSVRYGLGGEVGYLLQENLWLSAGYNFFGFKDPDLIGQDVTDRGLFARIRFKFDEDMFTGILQKFDQKVEEKAKP